jgi:hypothetical protein
VDLGVVKVTARLQLGEMCLVVASHVLDGLIDASAELQAFASCSSSFNVHDGSGWMFVARRQENP